MRRGDTIDHPNAIAQLRHPSQFAFDVMNDSIVGLEHFECAAHRRKLTLWVKIGLRMVGSVPNFSRMGQVSVVPGHPRIPVGRRVKLIVRPVVGLAFDARLHTDNPDDGLMDAEDFAAITKGKRAIRSTHIPVLRENFVAVMSIHDGPAITAHQSFSFMSGQCGQRRATSRTIQGVQRVAHASASIACWRIS